MTHVRRPLRWLHFSDLHLAPDQARWWQVEEDLQRSIADTLNVLGGPPDLLLFTGDLTATGAPEEFELVDALLRKLESWLGILPFVVAVPGNHDIARPQTRESRRALTFLADIVDGKEDPELAAQLWSERDASPIAPLFAPYTRWLDRRLASQARPEFVVHRSHFPGDLRVDVALPGVAPVTLVGLNSAWLQFRDSDYFGCLIVPREQFHAAVGGPRHDPLAPLRARPEQQNLLLQHHAPAWLTEPARQVFLGEIFHPERFAAALFGQLRGAHGERLAGFGGVPRHMFEAASLFGREKDRKGHIRILGYAAGTLAADGELRVWPLRRVRRGDHVHAFVPDLAFSCEDDGTHRGSFVLRERATLHPAPPADPAPPAVDMLRTVILAQIQASAPHEPYVLKGITGSVIPLDRVYVTPPLLLVERTLKPPDPSSCDPGEPRHTADAEIQRWCRSGADESLILVGEMGAGKSEMLLRLYGEALRLAAKSPQYPIPLWLTAATVAGDTGRDLVLARTKFSRDELVTCQRVGSPTFRLFLDGVDESRERFLRAVESFRAELGSCLHGVAASVRPGYHLPLPDVTTVRVYPWHEAQVEEFLARWADNVDSTAVAALRHSPYFDGLRPTLTNPLIASFCAHVAALHPESLRNRTELFRGVLDYVLQQSRQPYAGETAPLMLRSVPEMLGFLRPLALALIRGQRTVVSDAELRQAVFQADESPLGVADFVQRRFGLLTRCEDGYIFTIRGLAEYLAGLALFNGDVEAIADAAREAWALEPIRHAVVMAETRRPATATEILRRLLRDESTDDISYANGHLRAVITAALAAGDLAETLSKDVLALIVDAVVRRAAEETTSWVGDTTLDAVQGLLRGAHPLAMALRDRLWRLLEIPEGRARWFEVNDVGCVHKHVDRLSERDPEVRAAICRKLAAFVDHPVAQRFLAIELFDDQKRRTRPCIEAGLSLRRATRDLAFKPLQLQLGELLVRGGQLTSFAAALALRPDEAPAEALVEGLRRGGRAGYYFDDILNELVASTDGEAALSAKWPEWRTPNNRLHTAACDPDERVECMPLPPPSASTRSRIATGLLGALGMMPPDQLQRFLQLSNVKDALSHAADRIPEACLATVLPALVSFGLCRRGRMAVQELGQNNIRVAEILREMLIQALNTEASVAIDFPGRGLESLVRAGDREAITAYAHWLAKYYAGPIDDSAESLPADILGIDEIRFVAQGILERRVGDSFLPWPAETLRYFAPLWQTNAEIWAELARILCPWGSNLEVFVDATRSSRLPLDVINRLATTLDTLLGRHGLDPNGRDEQYYWHKAVSRLVDYVRVLGYPVQLVPFLERLAGRTDEPVCGKVALDATIALVPLLGAEELARLSQRRAAYFTQHPARLTEFPLHETRTIVGAAPEAWLEAFHANTAKVARTPNILRPLRDLLDVFPEAQQRVAATLWIEAVRGDELPWLETDWPSGYSRPADEARRASFASGMALETTEQMYERMMNRLRPPETAQ